MDGLASDHSRDFGTIRKRLISSSGQDLTGFTKTLAPKYPAIYRDIAFGYLAIFLSLALSIFASRRGVPSWIVAPGLALLVGYWVAYLMLFIHEAAHWGLAAEPRRSDSLGNLLIGWWAGMDVAAYRKVHFQHHQELGTTKDSEYSYFFPIDLKFLFKILFGVRVLEVLISRRSSGKSPSSKAAPGGNLQVVVAATIHGTVVGSLVLAGWWPSALGWCLGMGLVFPLFGALRQMLEHRSLEARADVDYREVDHGALSRLFGDGLFARTFGGAGFNRHLLHHWEPGVSYTRLPDLEASLMKTELGKIIEARRTTYWRTFVDLVSAQTAGASSKTTQSPAEIERRGSDGHCPMCGRLGLPYATAQDIEYFTTPETFRYLKCAECDVLFIDPMPLDRLAEIYPANYYSYGAGRNRSLVAAIKEWLDARAFRRFLKAIPGQRLSLLDVGGGDGQLASLMRRIEPRIRKSTVVDLDPGASREAQRNGHDYFCGSIETFRPNETFDAVMMLNLIEHVSDPRAVLRKAASLLSPGGRLYIKTPNFHSLDADLFRHHNWGGYHCPRHFVLFSGNSLLNLARAAGFRPVSFRYTQGAPFWSVAIFDLMRRWGWVRASKEHPTPHHPIMPVLQALTAAFDFARKPFAALSQMILVLEMDHK